MVKKFGFGMFTLCLNILFYAAVVLLVVRAAKFSWDFAYEVFGSAPIEEGNTEEETLTISKGMGPSAVGSILKDMGYVKHVKAFEWRLRISGLSGKIAPGTYQINKSMSLEDITALITDASAGEEVILETEAPSEDTEEESSQGEAFLPDLLTGVA